MGPEIIEWANEALQENHVVILGQDLNAPGPDVWMTSFSWPLGDEKATFAAYGLAGCTSVLIATPTRIYMNHIWEGPLFEANYDSEVLQLLQHGDPNHPNNVRMDWPDFTSPAIECIIFTPRERTDRERGPVPEGTLLFPSRIRILMNKIIQIVPALANNHAMIVDYRPWQASLEGHELLADSPRGKYIVRYDPVFAEATCHDRRKAGLEVWSEDRPKKVFEMTWDVPNQPNKRDLNERAACPEPSESSSTRAPATIHMVCTNVVDGNSPDRHPFCDCGGGTRVPIVTYAPTPCPWTNIKDIPTSMIISTTKLPAPTITNPPVYAFTVTEGNGDMVACASSSVENMAGFKVTKCAGSQTRIAHTTIPDVQDSG
ncbi:hypothetical protein Vi05172_g9847 [Venturia inaequalis]|nr:hypothetical protein Vi05172_g9847 [Venturia inaequalis]